MSSISAGTTSATALVHTADTSGALELKTNNGTTALTLSTAQNATFAGTLTTAANGIAKASLPTGAVLQVVSTTKTNTFSTTSTSYVDVTGLSVSITPSSATSKILVIVSLSGSETVGWGFQLVRNSTAICIGDSGGGSRMQGSGGMSTRDSNGINNPSANFLDSPATTSATTYKVQMYTPSATGYLNGTAGDANANYTVRSASTITVMEIAA
jgi:hypothetical protein